MLASILSRFGNAAALSVLLIAANGAFAQDASVKTETPPAQNSQKPKAAVAGSNSSATQSGKKAQPGSQTAKVNAAEKKPKPGQYATESEARSHCRGTIVWVDSDNFNHYAGSREYGKKPGAFACENG